MKLKSGQVIGWTQYHAGAIVAGQHRALLLGSANRVRRVRRALAYLMMRVPERFVCDRCGQDIVRPNPRTLTRGVGALLPGLIDGSTGRPSYRDELHFCCDHCFRGWAKAYLETAEF